MTSHSDSPSAETVGEGFAFNCWFLFVSDVRQFASFCRDTDCQPCIQEARRQWRVNSR